MNLGTRAKISSDKSGTEFNKVIINFKSTIESIWIALEITIKDKIKVVANLNRGIIFWVTEKWDEITAGIHNRWSIIVGAGINIQQILELVSSSMNLANL